MRVKYLFLSLVLLLIVTAVLAESQNTQEEGLPAVAMDGRGEKLEGILRLDPKEITVSAKDSQEKSVLLKWIESIKLEKIVSAIPGADQMTGEEYYSVRLQNSQEIFTLQKKYTFSLNTSLGVVTRTIDPGALRKESSSSANSKNGQPFIRDKNILLSLEIKF
jgi:hypothetical protein